MTHNISVQADCLTTLSLAAFQNDYPIVRSIAITYPEPTKTETTNGQSHTEQTLPIYRNCILTLQSNPEWISQKKWSIDELSSGQTLYLNDKALELATDKLYSLNDISKLTLTFHLTTSQGSDTTLLAQHQVVIDCLPADYWGGEQRQPDLLAAFVKPNGLYVDSLVRQVTDLLEAKGHSRSADGYQANTREKPYLMAAALWSVISQQRLAYSAPQASFARTGQRIRLPSNISQSRLVACLDSSLLFASCLEAMGLNSVIGLTRDHAFAGVWLIDERFPVLTNDDPIDLRKRVDHKDIVLFETTLVTQSEPSSFDEAIRKARELLDEDHEPDFVYMIDIAQARARQIRPLATEEEQAQQNEAAQIQALELPTLPNLPPVTADDRVIEETPDTRIDMWQRKLLDLTKRNNLLNLRERHVQIKLFCPAINQLEDCLSNGVRFKFISAELSPLNTPERAIKHFRLNTHDPRHSQYALDQMDHRILMVNQSHDRLQKNALNLLRRAKNDLEEGGSNTLFLALGMLKWREHPSDEIAFKAPLILLPVELSRKSAKSPIYLKHLSDEAPIFNLTLIEFLKANYSVDLQHFKDLLPEDSSGIDVNAILDTVREHIKDYTGFEVVEDCVLGCFSFAKYLMWKDLKDRLSDLKENRLVKHLVDHPKEAYQQTSEFVNRSDVDQIIDPANLYVPLNCDSSQLVAVEASGKAQDFVLEGPPGTGKSETIANMICHNLALGRTVLFVAEKMAALNVVYRRMEKIGLDHLCLELHSNKANKKSVLEQLKQAWHQPREPESTQWEDQVSALVEQRHSLNTLVAALHKKTHAGLSVREAIARVACFGSTHTAELNWQDDLAQSPIQTEADLKALMQQTKQLALAFSDTDSIDHESFNRLEHREWSNAWQSDVVNNLTALLNTIPIINTETKALLDAFCLDISIDEINQLDALQSINTLISVALKRPIAYALSSGANARLQALKSVHELKAEFDSKLSHIGHNVDPEKLIKTPIDEWKTYLLATRNGWLSRIINTFKLKRSAKALGYQPFANLDIAQQIIDARETQQQIESLLPDLSDNTLWQGWATTPAALFDSLTLGNQVYAASRGLLSLHNNPSVIISALEKQLVDDREYIEHSAWLIQWHTWQAQCEVFYTLKQSGKVLGICFDKQSTLSDRFDELSAHITTLLKQKTQLKKWCEWLAAKQQAENNHLERIVAGLESKTIEPQQAPEQLFTAFCQWLAPKLIDSNPTLRQFKSTQHQQLINDFCELDQQVAHVTARIVRQKMSNNVPDPSSNDSPAEFGILARELQKKTRHKPIRQLVQDMGDTIFTLCPCLMMSPLSVAQFLPSDFASFDLVIFDEASQMTTWDSVGAIARGKNIIVVGDPKQMPPTNFFSSTIDEDDPDEEDLESILDQALAARLPHKRLMGHYRSQHETLIAFSNKQYYENSLTTYPSADTKLSAVTLHRVNGIYDRGAHRNNVIEAQAVVKEIVKRLTNPDQAHQTIGVVTLNTDQQRTIEDLLDQARRDHPAIEPYFQSTDHYDGVFIKNLESVQGDERNIIMLSLGYGPTKVDSQSMSMNFGPLNKSGGERRLNVAITRATSEVLVFASFDSSMIDLGRTSAQAVKDLKHYLRFAEQGPIALAQPTNNNRIEQANFENTIAQALIEKGWQVSTQIGVSECRVDIGIIHPHKTNTFLAGIECDGNTYAKAPSARDRDRIRPEVLKNLGWHLIRVWSLDYIVDKNSTIEAIHQQLNVLLNGEQ